MIVLILVITSREPSRRTRSFVKELSQSLPYFQVFNRGKRTLAEINRIASLMRAKFMLLVHEWKANPKRMIFYEFNPMVGLSNDANSMYRRVFSLRLSGVKLVREMGVSGRIYNPRFIEVSIDKCSSELCFKSSEIFLKIYKYYISRVPDVFLEFVDGDGYVDLKIMDRSGLVCGPLIRIVKVDVFE